MKKRSHIFRGLASIFLALMVLFGTVMSVALSWEGRVNELLGISDDTFAKSQNPDDYIVNFAQLTQRAGNFLVARQPMADFEWVDLKSKDILGGRKGGVHISM